MCTLLNDDLLTLNTHACYETLCCWVFFWTSQTLSSITFYGYSHENFLLESSIALVCYFNVSTRGRYKHSTSSYSKQIYITATWYTLACAQRKCSVNPKKVKS